MTVPPQANALRPRIPGALKGLLILMVVSVAIHSIDRRGLSTAAPLLERKTDLAIPPARMGRAAVGVLLDLLLPAARRELARGSPWRAVGDGDCLCDRAGESASA